MLGYLNKILLAAPFLRPSSLPAALPFIKVYSLPLFVTFFLSPLIQGQVIDLCEMVYIPANIVPPAGTICEVERPIVRTAGADIGRPAGPEVYFRDYVEPTSLRAKDGRVAILEGKDLPDFYMKFLESIKLVRIEVDGAVVTQYMADVMVKDTRNEPYKIQVRVRDLDIASWKGSRRETIKLKDGAQFYGATLAKELKPVDASEVQDTQQIKEFLTDLAFRGEDGYSLPNLKPGENLPSGINLGRFKSSLDPDTQAELDQTYQSKFESRLWVLGGLPPNNDDLPTTNVLASDPPEPVRRLTLARDAPLPLTRGGGSERDRSDSVEPRSMYSLDVDDLRSDSELSEASGRAEDGVKSIESGSPGFELSLANPLPKPRSPGLTRPPPRFNRRQRIGLIRDEIKTIGDKRRFAKQEYRRVTGAIGRTQANIDFALQDGNSLLRRRPTEGEVPTRLASRIQKNSDKLRILYDRRDELRTRSSELENTLAESKSQIDMRFQQIKNINSFSRGTRIDPDAAIGASLVQSDSLIDGYLKMLSPDGRLAEAAKRSSLGPQTTDHISGPNEGLLHLTISSEIGDCNSSQDPFDSLTRQLGGVLQKIDPSSAACRKGGHFNIYKLFEKSGISEKFEKTCGMNWEKFLLKADEKIKGSGEDPPLSLELFLAIMLKEASFKTDDGANSLCGSTGIYGELGLFQIAKGDSRLTEKCPQSADAVKYKECWSHPMNSLDIAIQIFRGKIKTLRADHNHCYGKERKSDGTCLDRRRKSTSGFTTTGNDLLRLALSAYNGGEKWVFRAKIDLERYNYELGEEYLKRHPDKRKDPNDWEDLRIFYLRHFLDGEKDTANYRTVTKLADQKHYFGEEHIGFYGRATDSTLINLQYVETIMGREDQDNPGTTLGGSQIEDLGFISNQVETHLERCPAPQRTGECAPNFNASIYEETHRAHLAESKQCETLRKDVKIGEDVQPRCSASVTSSPSNFDRQPSAADNERALRRELDPVDLNGN